MSQPRDEHELDKEEFTEDQWQEVQDFQCGESPYQVAVANWLKADKDAEESAVKAIHDNDRPCRVWLYRLADGRLVGFGALGKSRWRWTGKKDPWVPISSVTWYAVHSDFQGKPIGPKEERYSYRILEDLIGEAQVDQETHPVLALNVHKDNTRAIDLYMSIGFTEELSSRVIDGEEHRRLAVVLNDEALKRILAEQSKK